MRAGRNSTFIILNLIKFPSIKTTARLTKKRARIKVMSDGAVLNNRYQLDRSLGAGGMSVVYLARDLMLERTVAIKVLREDYSSNLEFRERFRQEAKAAANLSHPNIVTVHDFGLDAGRLFIVMEYIPGTDLKTILRRKGRFTVEEAIPLIIQACAGIGYAHRAGLVHCDVKPQNLLVTPDQRLKITDFGIARALASIQPDEKMDVVWGSPQYFSPEQAKGEAPSPSSDVYALGVILYEMITGQLPFIAKNATELAQLHREALPIPPRQINPAIPLPLEQILLKILSKEPTARYRTADQLGRVIINFAASARVGEPTETVRAPVLGHPSNIPTREYPSRPISRPVSRPVSQHPVPIQRVQEIETGEGDPFDIDWRTWALGLLTLLAVGGLIPFWLWIYLLYNPPGR